MADIPFGNQNPKLSSGIDANTTKVSKLNAELSKTLTLSQKIGQAFGVSGSGMPGQQIANSGASFSGGFSGGGAATAMGVARAVGGAVVGIAGAAASAMPSVQEAVSSQLLTSQAKFSGMQGNVNSTVRSLMGMGTTSGPMDVQQAIAMGTAGGITPGLSGYNSQIMPGVMQLSNLTGSATSGMQAAVALNQASSVNELRMAGISVRGANGAMRDPAAVFKDIYNFAQAQSGGRLNKGNIGVALQSGNGLSNFLDKAAGGDQNLRAALQTSAMQFAQGGDLTRSSTIKTGLGTEALAAQSNLNQSQFGLIASSQTPEAKGFTEANKLLVSATNSLSKLVDSNSAAAWALTQLAKGETLASSKVGGATVGVMSSIWNGVKNAGAALGARAVVAGGSALRAGAVAEAVAGPETAGISGLAVGGTVFAASMLAPLINIIKGGGKVPGGASVSPQSASSQSSGAANLVISTASSAIGVPYSWGGGNLQGPTTGISQGANTTGFDCSSLVRYVMGRMGVILPRTSQEQQKCGTSINPRQAQAGDLLFWGNPAHHVAIYIGGGMMIQAPHTGGHVERVAVNLAGVTSASRVISGKTGTAQSGNLLKIHGSHASSISGTLNQIVSSIGGNTMSGSLSAGLASMGDLKGYTPGDAMSGGSVGGSGLGLGSSTGGDGSSSSMAQAYLSINSKTGILEHVPSRGQSVINYGGVVIHVDTKGAPIAAKDISKAIKDELKSLSINVKVATQ